MHFSPPAPCPRHDLPLHLVRLILLTTVLVSGSGCDDDPDIPTTGDPPLPDAARIDAEIDSGTGEEPPSWHAHIRPLVESRCLGCHQPGAVSGYDLSDTAWDGVNAPWWAGAVASAVIEGSMPPVLPDPACRAVQGPAPLSDDEVALFEAWQLGGYREGAEADYIPPAPRLTRDPGPATVRVDAGAAYIPAFSAGADSDRRCLPLDWPVEAEIWIRGVAVVPEARNMLRRAQLFVVDPIYAAQVDALDAEAPGAGYPCHAGPEVAGYRPLAAWLPEGAPLILPTDHAFAVAAGSRLVLQVQYSAHALDGEVPPERTAVDLWLAEAPPGTRVEAVRLAHTALQIPSERQVQQGRDFTLGVGGTVIGAWADMGSRGTALRAILAREADDRCVLDLPRFDRDWVGTWGFDPLYWVPLSVGDVLELRCTHDNRGEPGAPAPARMWGDGPEDERCDAILLIARPADALGGRPQCGPFAPCVAQCGGGADGALEPACFARCHATGEQACPTCLLQATGVCAQARCEAELQVLGACSAACDGADLGCLIDRCLDPFGALTRCLATPIDAGDCAGPYGACGVRWGG